MGDLPGPRSRPLLHSRSFPARAEIAFQSLTVRELFSGASYTTGVNAEAAGKRPVMS